MSQIFHPSTNTISRLTIFGGAGFVVVLVLALAAINESPYITEVGVARSQPIPFSHKHHVGDDGIDCRYCHTSVENSATAGVPPTKTCMSCHSVLYSNVAYLEPIRESYRTDTSIEWVKVHRLADYVYFNHSIHLAKGVGCSTCHGRVDQMPLMFQANTLLMQWCLDCHRNPEKALRPLDKVYDMAWQPAANQAEIGKQYLAERNIRNTSELTSCSTCHR